MDDQATHLHLRRESTLQFLASIPCVLPDPAVTDPWQLGKPARLPGTQRGNGTGNPLPISNHGRQFFKFLDPDTGRLVQDSEGRTAWALMPSTASIIDNRTGWIARRV